MDGCDARVSADANDKAQDPTSTADPRPPALGDCTHALASAAGRSTRGHGASAAGSVPGSNQTRCHGRGAVRGLRFAGHRNPPRALTDLEKKKPRKSTIYGA